jgi:uncharacterized protein
MPLSMHQSAAALDRTLNNLAAILEKAAAHAAAKKIEPAIFLNSRLYPDMFPLVRQVQLATDTARTGMARLAALEFTPYEDNETTFTELLARIGKTRDYLQSIKPEQLEGREDVIVTWQWCADGQEGLLGQYLEIASTPCGWTTPACRHGPLTTSETIHEIPGCAAVLSLVLRTGDCRHAQRGRRRKAQGGYRCHV